MSKNTEQKNTNFKGQLGGFFHELFKNVGMAVPPYAHERFRSTGERMVMLIEQVAKHKAVQIVTTLQKAVSSGFEKVESEINNLQTLILSHTTLIGELIAGQKHTAKLVGELEAKLKELEHQAARRWGAVARVKQSPEKSD